MMGVAPTLILQARRFLEAAEAEQENQEVKVFLPMQAKVAMVFILAMYLEIHLVKTVGLLVVAAVPGEAGLT
jgi:hypothetical protein